MELFRSRDALDRLEDLLDRERQAVLNGDFDRLHRLVAEKEHLLETAKRGSVDPDRIASLGIKARRNQQLLDAAGDGIRAVSDLLNNLKKGAGLSTYDSAGQRKEHAGTRATVERRA